MQRNIQGLITRIRPKSQISDCKETYDDLCAYHEFIKLHGDLPEVNAIQRGVEKAWQDLQAEASSLVTFVTHAAKWVEHYDVLDKCKTDLMKLKQDMIAVPKPLKKSTVESIEKKMNDSISLKDLETMCSGESGKNAELFGQTLGQVNVLADSIQSDLEALKTQLEKAIQQDAERSNNTGAHGGVSVGPDGATTSGTPSNIFAMTGLPNMSVVVPCDVIEARKATGYLLSSTGGRSTSALRGRPRRS